MLSVAVTHRKPGTPVFNIGVMSRLTGLPIHTLRWIEQQGLISPFRTEGNQRMFSEVEVGLIREIRELMEQHVNLPGIRVILKMRGEIRGMKQSRGKSGRRKPIGGRS